MECCQGQMRKGFLSQNDAGCGSACDELIIRYNVTSETWVRHTDQR